MTADINGYAWGYADALYENGIRHLFSCVHTHHGMFPLNQKQTPFYWQSPKGNKILVWVGEHYHFANELGCAPLGMTTYTIQDNLDSFIHSDQENVTEKRILQYKVDLESQGYDYSFIPLMVSGVITDNAPPSGEIMDFIQRWNSEYGETFPAKMCTLEEYFSRVEEEVGNIPTYQGDWNDWWADGVGSTMNAVKSFRDGQRTYQLAKKLSAIDCNADQKLVEESEDKLMMYAEHTWGYSSSVSEPWNTLVNDLDLRKTAYAINGTTAAAENLDYILAQRGEKSISANRKKKFKILNPHSKPIHDIVKLELEKWESINGERIHEKGVIERLIINDTRGKQLNYGLNTRARAIEIEIEVELDANEEMEVFFNLAKKPPLLITERFALIGADGVQDVIIDKDGDHGTMNRYLVETPFYIIKLDKD